MAGTILNSLVLPPRFLTLPIEVRSIIYESVFEGIEARLSTLPSLAFFQEWSQADLHILLTCHQCYYEGLPLLWSTANFTTSDAYSDLVRMKACNPASLLGNRRHQTYRRFLKNLELESFASLSRMSIDIYLKRMTRLQKLTLRCPYKTLMFDVNNRRRALYNMDFYTYFMLERLTEQPTEAMIKFGREPRHGPFMDSGLFNDIVARMSKDEGAVQIINLMRMYRKFTILLRIEFVCWIGEKYRSLVCPLRIPIRTSPTGKLEILTR